ncbi:hypothetical protein Tco_0134089 [Tanacetum coccineum]
MQFSTVGEKGKLPDYPHRASKNKGMELLIVDCFQAHDGNKATFEFQDCNEFKNKEVIELCGIKWIRGDISNAETPNKLKLLREKNRDLIEAYGTMALLILFT